MRLVPGGTVRVRGEPPGRSAAEAAGEGLRVGARGAGSAGGGPAARVHSVRSLYAPAE